MDLSIKAISGCGTAPDNLFPVMLTPNTDACE